ncbi:hypothetical protein K450DRAFT_243519 [Umbelopsis ramanniana AG]|uniref:Carbohydrate kinase PfkB domain-containing protein n=1 Tax=Umbelopsis ramanniana AG TaxID=1314678 RepID=A0AAD5E7T2_UMBRA|nr:uncharacterized protein K450DRAFT_243519 [Umbelopsis ramanniana AG]KAI8579028.1 hypothetical protein K450DRAFT_243519 [Umbelopsis ramanniana AG]
MSSNGANVLLVGQLYQDFILHVDEFPAEDAKKRASKLEIRSGGNCGNTLMVLSQLPSVQTWCMTSLGPKEEAGSLLLGLENQGVHTSTCVFHDHGVNPSSYVIHAANTGTRTIISYNEAQDITLSDFQQKVETAMSDTKQHFTWVHFEGRNIDNAVQQIDWMHNKAIKENWRDRLTISVELEKPDRENIDTFLDKGDVVFFSKLFAEKRGFSDAPSFLKAYSTRCRPKSILFCTWGAQGATCLQRATNQILSAPALNIDQVVDTVGAGDTFTAGVIYGLSHGFNVLDVLTFSCELAGRKVAQTGFDQLKQQLDARWNKALDESHHRAFT